MSKHIRTSILSFIFGISLTFYPSKGISQSVELIPEPGFLEYATYYISGFDIQTGSSDIQLCRYRLHLNGPPAYVRIEFIATITSPQIGINTPLTIVDLETDIDNLQADMIFDNRNISSDTQMLYDVNGNPVTMIGQINEVISPSSFDQILSTILTSGRLPDGEYTFTIRLYSGSNLSDLSLTGQDIDTKIIRTPTFISLESPGGSLSDVNTTQISTVLPIFNWTAQNCMTCENYIRVAEFDPDEHSSLEQAIDDNLSLPFNGNSWESIGTLNSFQYPISGARQLEFGKMYVWQVKQELFTTEGQEEILSPIWIFQITEASGNTTQMQELSALLLVLRNVIGEAQFNELFGPNGELNGYNPSGYYTNDGVTIDEAGANYILNQILSGSLELTQVQTGE